MRVLVTGGAGFVGSHLADRLVAAGLEVWVLDDFSRGCPEWVPAACRTVEADLRDADRVRAGVSEARPDAVAHLAALHYIPAVDEAPALAWSTNVDATRTLLDALRAIPPGRLVFASTAAVYPDAADPLSEDVAAAPIDLYGRTKAEGERLVAEFARATAARCVSARLFNVVGPRETNPHVVPEIVSQLLAGAPELELGTLTARRDFVDVRDVAAALERLLLGAPPGYSVYNVGSGRTSSVYDLVRTCEALLGQPIRVRPSAKRMRPVERAALVADVSAIERDLGWRPERTLAGSLAELLGVAEQPNGPQAEGALAGSSGGGG